VQINSGLFKDLEQGLITSKELRTKRFKVLFSEFDLGVDIESFSQKYLTHLAQGSMLLPGALDTVRSLYPEYKLLLVTNGIGDVQRVRFKHSELRPYFKDIIISEEFGAVKPSLEFFNAVFKIMGNPEKSEVLMIGDSLTADMAGGIHYGIDTCWFNPHKFKNENNLKISYEICELQEVLEIVK
jgi:putative hydrolase of the HAD superfamily